MKERKKKSVANVKANVGGIIRSNDSSLYIFRNINYIFFLERERERVGRRNVTEGIQHIKEGEEDDRKVGPFSLHIKIKLHDPTL
jgi:hypothetical protein